MPSTPLYQSVYEGVRKAILKGEYSLGECIPTEKELCSSYHVSRVTVKTALMQLVDEGVLDRKRGKGTFVISRPHPRDQAEATRSIGLIVGGISDSYGLELFSTLERLAARHGYSLIVKSSHENQEREEQCLEELLSMGVQGILIIPVQVEFYDARLISLIYANYPIVVIDRKLLSIRSCFCGIDNVEAARIAARYLIDHGHENISLVMQENVHNSSIKDRIIGFNQECSTAKIKVDEDLWIKNLASGYTDDLGNESIENDISTITHKLEDHPEITCCMSLDNHCGELVVEACHRMGKSIPSDYSLLTFDTPTSIISDRNITHIRQDEIHIGTQAFNLLMRKINNPELKHEEAIAPARLVECGTVSTLQ